MILTEKLSFEEAVTELNAIVERIEEGEIGLEQSLADAGYSPRLQQYQIDENTCTNVESQLTGGVINVPFRTRKKFSALPSAM